MSRSEQRRAHLYISTRCVRPCGRLSSLQPPRLAMSDLAKEKPDAIYHLSAKPISRATGRSATGAAAYRAGVKITDERTGQVFDYTRKRGIDYAEILAPANATEWAHDR